MFPLRAVREGCPPKCLFLLGSAAFEACPSKLRAHEPYYHLVQRVFIHVDYERCLFKTRVSALTVDL